MAYSSTDLLRDTMRAAGGLPALDPEIDDPRAARIRAYMNAAIDWYADSPAELLEELLKADWHQHKTMHMRLEQLVAEEFAKDGEFRRLALAALKGDLERKAEELADQAERNRGIERAA